MIEREDHGRGAVPETELGEDVVDMGLDRALAANPVIVTVMGTGAPGCDNHGVGMDDIGEGNFV